MSTTWILIANGSTAKLYESSKVGHEQTLISDFDHPESREKSADLVTDRVGHYESRSGEGRGSYVEETDPKDVEIDKFAAEIIAHLESGRNHDRFQHLILAASPHFLGCLLKHCNKQLQKMISHTIEKDYTKISEKELLAHLLKATKPW